MKAGPGEEKGRKGGVGLGLGLGRGSCPLGSRVCPLNILMGGQHLLVCRYGGFKDEMASIRIRSVSVSMSPTMAAGSPFFPFPSLLFPFTPPFLSIYKRRQISLFFSMA